MSQRGGFAGGGHAQDELAVQIHGAGEQIIAGLLIGGQGFAGEHRFIHGRGAGEDRAIHGNAIAGFEDHEVAGIQAGHGSFHFLLRDGFGGCGGKAGAQIEADAAGRRFGRGGRDEFARGGRGEREQGAQGVAGAVAHPGFAPMAGADERDDRRRLHEVEMPACAAQQRPRAVTECRGGTERHEGVHVGGADKQLPPGAAIELRPAPDLHPAGEGKGQPAEPVHVHEAKAPFARHEQGGHRQTDEERPLPVGLAGRGIAGSGGGEFPGGIAGLFDGGDQGGEILFRSGIPADGEAAGGDLGGSTVDAGNGLRGRGDFAGAVAARHAADVQAGGGTGGGGVHFLPVRLVDARGTATWASPPPSAARAPPLPLAGGFISPSVRA